jgi:hypothetical protein
MKKLLREPFLHFLLLGAAIFAIHDFVKGDGDRQGLDNIAVSQGAIEHLSTGFVRTWHRPPSQEELDSLIADYVREEVYYREAVALGLDKDDIVIRRRLRQKLEFISEDIAGLEEPSEKDLQTYLDEHAGDFVRESQFTFDQIYIDPRQHPEGLPVVARRLLDRLNATQTEIDPSEVGDATMLERNYRQVSQSAVAAQFGPAFTEQLGSLPVGRWLGPIQSGLGTHLVFLTERIEGDAPSLDEVRESVRRDWMNRRRIGANEAFYQRLLSKYEVMIEPQVTVEAQPRRLAARP